MKYWCKVQTGISCFSIGCEFCSVVPFFSFLYRNSIFLITLLLKIFYRINAYLECDSYPIFRSDLICN